MDKHRYDGSRNNTGARGLHILWAGALLTAMPVAWGGLSHGILEVRQLNRTNNGYGSLTPAARVETPRATATLTVFAANRGDYDLDCGPELEPRAGVLIACAAELQRDNGWTGDSPAGGNRATASVARYADTSCFFVAVSTAGGGALAAGSEFNMNTAVAYFPLADGWTAAAVYATDDGAGTGLVASANLRLDAAIAVHSNGVYDVTIPGVTNDQAGVLLACASANEGVYALTQAHTNGSFTIYTRNNGADGLVGKQANVGFVYVPFTRPDVVAGRVRGNGALAGGGAGVTATSTGYGTYSLHIAGHSPATGTLVVTPAGGDSNNTDNIVSYAPESTHWVIESRDLPGAALEQLPDTEDVFSFAFIPFGPGEPLPAPAHTFRHGQLAMTQFTTSNEGSYSPAPSVGVSVTHSNGPLRLFTANRGDVELDFCPAYEPTNGVLIACVRQNRRDNSAAGDAAGENSATASSCVNGRGFFVAINATSGGGVTSGSEYNMDVAFAYFPFHEGWRGGAAYNTTNQGAITTFYGSPGIGLGREFVDLGGGRSVLSLPGVNSRTDGVLLVCGAQNEDNYALSRAATNGTFQLFVHDNGVNGASYEPDCVTFVYLPVGLRHCVHGRIRNDAQAQLASGAFTVAKRTSGEYLLAIPGHTPSSGTLLVSPEGGDDYNADNIVTYAAEGDGWCIQTRDLAGATLQELARPDEEAFSFAFFPYVVPKPRTGTLIILR